MIDGTTQSMFGFDGILAPAPTMGTAWDVSLNHMTMIAVAIPIT